MSINKISRNNYAAVMRVVNSAGFLVEREHLDIRPTLVSTLFPDNQQFSPTQSDNWSRIAWKRLGNGRHWWVIADFSGLIDPFTDLLPVQKQQYATTLLAAVTAGACSQITVKDPTKLHQGDNILVENLDPNNAASFQTVVLGVSNATGIVSITPVTAPAIPATLSRVSRVYKQGVSLTCPSVHRAFFEALNFTNPLNVLVQ